MAFDLSSIIKNLGFGGSTPNAAALPGPSSMPDGLINRTGASIDGVPSIDPTSAGTDWMGNSIPSGGQPYMQPQNLAVLGNPSGLPSTFNWGAALTGASKALKASQPGTPPPAPMQPMQLNIPQSGYHGVDPQAIAALIQANAQRMQGQPMQRPPQGLLGGQY
jgi:hypothetical protein